jgi:hypothetical protein
MAETVLRGINDLLRNIRHGGPLELRWAGSELRSPAITHGPNGSVFSFYLSPVTDDIYSDLSAAKRYGIPVRLVSLRRPLSLIVRDLERVGEGTKIAGWVDS